MFKSFSLSALIVSLSAFPSLAQLPALPLPVPAPPNGMPPSFPVNNSTPKSPNFPLNNSNPVSEEYILGPGDRIQIDIFNVPEYSGDNGKHQVQLDGTLNLPLIAHVKVQGLTLAEATASIKKLYGEYLQRPLITLNLLAPRPLQIAIAGEVFRPGSYTISPTGGTPGTIGQVGIQLPTLTQALKVAGGITPSADVRQVKIRRRLGNREEIVNADLWELLQSGDLRQDFALRDGDTVYIPTITNVNVTESSQLSFASFAGESKQPINIAVVGEVNRPGTYTLTVEMGAIARNPDPNQVNDVNFTPDNIAGNTVTTALKKAGGITESADIRNISVRRLTRAGTEQTINIDLRKLLYEGELNQDVKLQPGDTVMVPKATNLEEAVTETDIVNASFSPDIIKVSVVGEVFRPGSMALPPKTTLNQALLATGGFVKSRAQSDQVELIRINRNGTVAKKQIKINFSAKENDPNNPILQNNDVIMVKRNGRAAFSDTVGNTLAPISPLNGVLGVFRLFNSLF
jgi:polysaccharide export outer membrane protein